MQSGSEKQAPRRSCQGARAGVTVTPAALSGAALSGAVRCEVQLDGTWRPQAGQSPAGFCFTSSTWGPSRFRWHWQSIPGQPKAPGGQAGARLSQLELRVNSKLPRRRSSFGEPRHKQGTGRVPCWLILINKSAFPRESPPEGVSEAPGVTLWVTSLGLACQWWKRPGPTPPARHHLQYAPVTQ